MNSVQTMNLAQVVSQYEKLRVAGDLGAASQVLLDAWQSGLQEPEILYKIAESFYLQTAFEQADKFVSLALKYQPSNPKFSYLAGMNALALKQPSAAHNCFTLIPRKARLFYTDIELAKLNKMDPEANYGCDDFASAIKKCSELSVLADGIQHHIDVLRHRREITQEEVDLVDALLRRYETQSHDTAKINRLKAQFYYYLGDLKAASSYYRAYLSLHPDSAVAQYNLSQVLLGLGEFTQGYALMHHRQQVHAETGGNRAFAESIGLSEMSYEQMQSLKGKSLVVIPEQGLGDQIWSLSFLHTFASVFECSLEVWVVPKLYAVAQSMQSSSIVIKNLVAVADDYSQTRLPHAADGFIDCVGLFFMLHHAGIELMPASSFLSSDQALTKRLRNKYLLDAPLSDKADRIVGLAWKSINSSLGQRKNIPLDFLGTLSELDTLQFISCQYGEVTEDLKQLQSLGVNISHDTEINNFDALVEAFSQVDACDKVVTCSNITAHIAGALGKPTLLIASSPAIWYWNQPGQSRWYSSVEVVIKPLLAPWSDIYPRLQKFLA